MSRRSLGRLVAIAPVAVIAITFAGRASQNAGLTTYPLIGRSLLGLGDGAIGLVAAAAGILSVGFSSLVVGRSKVLPASYLLAAGQALNLAGLLLLAVPAGRGGLVAAALLLGAGGGLGFPSLMTVVSQSTKGSRVRALALMSVVLSISLVAGPLLEAGLIKVLGGSLRASMAAMAGLALVAAGVSARMAYANRGRPAQGPRLAGSSKRSSPARGATPGLQASSAGVRAALRLALTVMLTYQVPYVALVSFGALLARHDGASSSGAQLAFGVFFAVSAGVRVLLAWVGSPRSSQVVLVVSAGATVLGVAGLGLSSNFAELLVAMAMLGFPHGTTFPLASSLIAEAARSSDQELVRANGRLMAGTNMATVAVPFAFGWMAHVLGYRSAFLLLEFPVVIFAVLLAYQLTSASNPLRLRTSAPGPSPQAG